MSNTRNNSLRFPSQRTVGQVRKDARRLSQSTGIGYQVALDISTKNNGLNMRFCEAVAHLLQTQRPTMKPNENVSNMHNANKGQHGTNRQYDQRQGNRSKQLPRVTMMIKPGVLSDAFITENKLERLGRSAVVKAGLLNPDDHSDRFYLEHYECIRFPKPIKGGTKNVSGALQRIRGIMVGRLENKQLSRYWIGSVCHTDTKHPSEKLDDWVYCPAIDGY